MKSILVLMCISCATVGTYAESESCPMSMTEQQQGSGVVRCRAMCSSYGRDMAAYDKDCKCYCAPGAVDNHGGYRPIAPKKPVYNGSET